MMTKQFINLINVWPPVLHYFVCGLIIIASSIGFFNSGVVMFRSTSANTGRNITVWLLLDSLFETARVLQLFMSEVLVNSNGPAQKYDMILGGAQYCELFCFL